MTVKSSDLNFDQQKYPYILVPYVFKHIFDQPLAGHLPRALQRGGRRGQAAHARGQRPQRGGFLGAGEESHRGVHGTFVQNLRGGGVVS